jgi:hypothetical protein
MANQRAEEVLPRGLIRSKASASFLAFINANALRHFDWHYDRFTYKCFDTFHVV